MADEPKLTRKEWKIIEKLEETEQALEPKKTIKDIAKKLKNTVWIKNDPPSRDYVFMQPGEFGADVGFLPQGKTAMLISPGGVGKTFALIQCAIAVATGGKWFGTYQASKPAGVVLITAEEDELELWKRIRGILLALGIDRKPHLEELLGENLTIIPLCGIKQRFTDKTGVRTIEFEDLKNFLDTEENCSLVILDPASYFMGPDCEIDNAAATDWITLLNKLAQTAGKPAILVAHHTNKSALGNNSINQAIARGSSALVDGVRWVAALQRKSDEEINKIMFKLVKSNHCFIPDGLELERDTQQGGMLKPSTIKTSDENSDYKRPKQQENSTNSLTDNSYTN